MQSLAVDGFRPLALVTGYPFSLFSPEWATNYQLENSAVPVSSARPKTGSFIVAQASGGTGPNVFQDPGITMPPPTPTPHQPVPCCISGGRSLRNGCAAQVLLILILAWPKTWPITENQFVKFSWQMFNVTTPLVSTFGTMSLNGNNSLSSSSSFGNFSSTAFQSAGDGVWLALHILSRRVSRRGGSAAP